MTANYGLVDDRPVGQPAQIHFGEVEARHRLGHEDADDLLQGIDPIVRLRRAGPAEFAERAAGLQGVIRGKQVRTTISDKATPCPLDHVNRQFKAARPNALWLSDFTYVATWAGFVYVAFVIDAYARQIVGWRVSRTAHAGFVLDALEQALHDRQPLHRGGLVHHSDRGSQYVSIKYTERLAEAGIEPSVGSVGDSYDNALAETVNGLYKAEVIHRRGPWRSFEAVEFATLEWVDWFNNRRLLEPLATSRRPRPRSATTPRWTNQPWQRDSSQTASGKPGAVHRSSDLPVPAPPASSPFSAAGLSSVYGVSDMRNLTGPILVRVLPGRNYAELLLQGPFWYGTGD